MRQRLLIKWSFLKHQEQRLSAAMTLLVWHNLTYSTSKTCGSNMSPCKKVLSDCCTVLVPYYPAHTHNRYKLITACMPSTHAVSWLLADQFSSFAPVTSSSQSQAALADHFSAAMHTFAHSRHTTGHTSSFRCSLCLIWKVLVFNDPAYATKAACTVCCIKRSV